VGVCSQCVPNDVPNSTSCLKIPYCLVMVQLSCIWNVKGAGTEGGEQGGSIFRLLLCWQAPPCSKNIDDSPKWRGKKILLGSTVGFTVPSSNTYVPEL
jgi:hypothetical protein